LALTNFTFNFADSEVLPEPPKPSMPISTGISKEELTPVS